MSSICAQPPLSLLPMFIRATLGGHARRLFDMVLDTISPAMKTAPSRVAALRKLSAVPFSYERHLRIVCTHNPRADYLRRVLNALRVQSFAVDRWELIIIDNASVEGTSLM